MTARVALVPSPASARYLPDGMELEALARAATRANGEPLEVRARFSDATGRERAGSTWRELALASGVVVVETSGARVVTSEALFAVADAACPCGEGALVDIHELYKRTHGGAAPARLLRACSLGLGLRGRCRRCGRPLDRALVRSSIEAPFAHVAVSLGPAAEDDPGLEALARRLRRATGFAWRAVTRPGA